MICTAHGNDGAVLKDQQGRPHTYDTKDSPNGWKLAVNAVWASKSGGYVLTSEPIDGATKWKVDNDGAYSPVP